MSSTEPSRETSQTTPVTMEGSKPSQAACNVPASRSATTTLAPSFTRPETISSPIPCAPPVTTATLPSNLPIILLHRPTLFGSPDFRIPFQVIMTAHSVERHRPAYEEKAQDAVSPLEQNGALFIPVQAFRSKTAAHKAFIL